MMNKTAIRRHLREIVYCRTWYSWHSEKFLRCSRDTRRIFRPDIFRFLDQNFVWITRNSWKNKSSTFLWYDTDPIENDASKNYSTHAHVFVAAVTFLPSHCLATIWDTYIHTDWWKGFMEYAVVMDWGAMLCIPSSVKIGFGIQKLVEWVRFTDTHTHTHTAWWSHEPTLSCQNKESRLKSNTTKVALTRMQFAPPRLEHDHHKTCIK
jgi:hypothetical protein